MLSIGDFARFAGVSVRMLRHYDALGLLSPTFVDPHSGYRFYDPNLLARAHALVAFKELGFTLEQVGQLLDQGAGQGQVGDMLEQRRVALHDQIAADQRRLDEIDRRLRLLEGNAMSAMTFEKKSLPAIRLAQLTDSVEDMTGLSDRVGPLFGRVYAALGAAGVAPEGPGIGWYLAEGDAMTFGAGVESLGDIAGLETGNLEARDSAITTIYRGSMAGIGQAWQELGAHVLAQGYEPAGPCREVYLEAPMDSPQAWVTELQQPVKTG